MALAYIGVTNTTLVPSLPLTRFPWHSRCSFIEQPALAVARVVACWRRILDTPWAWDGWRRRGAASFTSPCKGAQQGLSVTVRLCWGAALPPPPAAPCQSTRLCLCFIETWRRKGEEAVSQSVALPLAHLPACACPPLWRSRQAVPPQQCTTDRTDWGGCLPVHTQWAFHRLKCTSTSTMLTCTTQRDPIGHGD